MVTVERLAAPFRRPAMLDDLVGGVLAAYDARRPRSTAADRKLIVRAGKVAEQSHEGQLRQTGEPYITHPVAVATIVAELGLDARSVASALLHDAVEDTGLTLEHVTEEFGPEVGAIVDGVTKLDRLQFDSKEAQQAATVRKMLVAMATDWRVLVIKLADRLHNMRTVAVMPEWKQRRTAQETLDIYAPLAHRLGIQELKWQLEDLAFATLAPQALRRDRADGGHARPRARRVPGPGPGGGARTAGRVGGEGRRDRSSQAPVEHLREDGGAGQGVRRDPRPRGPARHRRVREGLLGRARLDPRHLEPGPGSLQGLHQQPEVQPLPVAAHHRDRARGQAHRGPDPDPARCTGGPSTASPRTGATRSSPRTAPPPPRPRWPGSSASWTGSRRPSTPSSSSRP